jgi:hypothetical protein
MNCDFCFETHTNDIDIEAIKNIPKLLEENYPEQLKNKKLERIFFSILGGELFSDDIPDNMFDIYEELCNNILDLVRRYLPDMKIDIDWFSNGVNTKPERILKLFKNTTRPKINQWLRLSYDPIGRFKTDYHKKMFLNTFNYFYDNKRPLHIVTMLSKPNIDIIINNKDDFFNNHPLTNIHFYFNYYTPNTELDIYQPNDDDLYNFHVWALEHDLFQSDLIAIWIDSIYKNRKPMKTCLYDKDVLYYDMNFIKNKVIPRIDKGITSEDITKTECFINMSKRGCLLCEYKDICISPCWLTILSKDYNINNCYAKRLIKYLYNHPEIIKRYNSIGYVI